MPRGLDRGVCILGAVALLLGGCGKPAGKGPAEAGGAAPAGPFRAGVVFDVGGRGDRSFNDAAYRGLERAEQELGIEPLFFEPSEPVDRESGLRRYASEGCNVVIGVGFMFTDEIRKLAVEYPELRFACVDLTVLPGDEEGKRLPPNLVGLKFREEEGAFLVGALAAMVSNTGKVGFIGGMNVPLIQKFEAGYRAGVRHVNEDCQVLVAYAGETPEAFKDATKGKSLAVGMYDQGADIIFHASGQTGRGVFQAAVEKDGLAIGVDSDQYEEAPGHVLTSMVKRVDVAVFDVIQAVKEGTFQPGVQVFGLAEDGVGLVRDDRNRDLIPDMAYIRIQALRQEIIEGRIQVPTTR